jgi:hypothetical protein
MKEQINFLLSIENKYQNIVLRFIHLWRHIRKPVKWTKTADVALYNALEKIPTNIVMSFSSKLHVEHNQRGVGGQFLRPISQELCYIYLPIHIQYPSSKIRSMQIFIISPLQTTFMT